MKERLAMRSISFVLIISIFIFFPIYAQNYENDPLEDGYIIHDGGGQEIISSTWDHVEIYKYFKEMEISPWDTVISVLQYNHSTSAGIPDMMTADLDGDTLNEIVKVWIQEGRIEIAVLKPDPHLLAIDGHAEWQKIVRLQKTDPPLYDADMGIFLPHVVLVQCGNFDSDLQKEFVTAYWADDGGGNGFVNLTVYDVDDTLGVYEKASIMDQQIVNPPKVSLCEDDMCLFDIECADFNGDEIEEILLVGREPASPIGWQLFAKIYAYDQMSGSLNLKVRDAIFTQADSLYDVANLNLASGHFSATSKDGAIIGFFQYNPSPWEDQGTDTLSFTLIPIEANNSLTDISAGSPVLQKKQIIEKSCWVNRISTLEAKDVNNDGQDEIVSAFSIREYSYNETMQTFKIYQMPTELNLAVWADLDAIAKEYYASIAIGDIRIESEQEIPYSEFIINLYSGALIYQLQYDTEGFFKQAVLLYNNDENVRWLRWGGKTEPVQIAECDGDIRLGSPRRFSATQILQPLVILNAPPIHFDMFDEQIYDVCSSYNENDPEFTSSYVKESSQLTELETEINRDWALSTSVSAGFSFWGVSVSSHFSQTWGDKFSKVDNTTTKVTVGISVDAIEDDRIYAVVMDYDIWEYPIYLNGMLKAHALVVEPNAIENRWFPSKSWSGHSYIPEHEVGNILSYREYPLLANNPLLDEKIKGDYNNSFVLDANSSYDWELQFDDFQSSQSSTTKEYTRDWGVSVSGWGCGFSIDGHYHSENINTQRTAVATGLKLDVHLDGIDMGIGEVGYIVTPYAYWANNGALVVDYAVKPELAAVGGTPTWWQIHYQDRADPAFILPWRYDPEKGYTLQEEVKRYQTKDIQFYPDNPNEGEEVTIEVRIHNFSLIPTPGLVGVRFYLGDPDSGGVLLVNTSGETEVFTDQPIPARGTEDVRFAWTVDNTTGTFPRIYAIIDADDELAELHQNNNKSWAILNISSETGMAQDDNDKIPSHFDLLQNYPNPFNSSTKISYQIPAASQVELSIYNLLGQKVARLISEKQSAGTYEVDWNAAGFTSGIYFCRLATSQGFAKSKKLVLLR